MRPAISRVVTRIITSPARRDLTQFLAGLGRRTRGAAPVIDYFHQVDDPYSHIAAQLLAPLARRYNVVIRPWLVPPPEDSAAPERERLKAYALRDAPRRAAEYGLTYPGNAGQPGARAVTLANAALAAALSTPEFAEGAVAVGTALWTGDIAALEAAAGAAPDLEAVQAVLARGATRRKRLGHYLSAMLHFEGEWYWGVDRLNHLEERLAATGRDTTPSAPMLAPFRDMRLGPVPKNAKPATIEVWFSFRSPYSWIAFPRVRKLAHYYGARLELRFILPMVMRGLPVPPVKRMYIMLDTEREADRVNLPYGCIVDPVGPGAARALAVLHHAIPLGCGEDFAELGMRAAFADGIALAEDAGLFDVARQAGLTDAQTAEALADDSWRQVADANRQALFDAGLWGAPTYRVNGGPAHWGQDRLWALEQDLLRAMSTT
jgi:2-hydroxychromene-2-carboxylate isomerase